MKPRCMYYDDGGNPINGGCFRHQSNSSCGFIHPSDPQWKYTPKSSRDVTKSRNGGGGARRGRGSSWGAPPLDIPSRSTTSTAWDSSSWADPSSSPTATSRDSSATRGAQPSGNNDTRNEGSSKVTDGGWGGSGESGWGDSGWGHSGWGEGDSGGWDTSNKSGSGSGWATDSVNGRRAEVPNSVTVPPRAREEKKHTRPPPAVEQPFTPTRLDPPTTAPDWSHIPTTNSSKEIRAPSVAPTESSTSIAQPGLLRKPLSRVQVYNKVIKMVQHIAELRLELDASQADMDQWKRTQTSPEYAHASRKTQEKLDLIRGNHTQKVQSLSKRLKHALEILADLPDISPRLKRTPRFDTNRIMSYTAELKSWIEELRLHQQMVSSEPLPPEPPSPAPESGSPNTASRDPSSWTWADIHAMVSQLETRVDHATEQFYSRTFTHFWDIDEKAAALVEASREIQDPLPIETVENVDTKANAVGDELGNQAERTAELLAKIHRNKQAIEYLKARKKENEDLQTQIEAQFAQFEEWQVERAERIRQLTEQIQNLHTLRRPSSSPVSITMDEVLPGIRVMVLERLRKEVIPVLQNFRNICTENNRKITQEMYEKLRPTLEMTDDIVRRAQQVGLSKD